MALVFQSIALFNEFLCYLLRYFIKVFMIFFTNSHYLQRLKDQV